MIPGWPLDLLGYVSNIPRIWLILWCTLRQLIQTSLNKSTFWLHQIIMWFHIFLRNLTNSFSLVLCVNFWLILIRLASDFWVRVASSLVRSLTAIRWRFCTNTSPDAPSLIFREICWVIVVNNIVCILFFKNLFGHLNLICLLLGISWFLDFFHQTNRRYIFQLNNQNKQ